MPKAVDITIVVPDDVEDRTIKGFVRDLRDRFLDDSADCGEPAWIVTKTEIRPADKTEADEIEQE